MYRTIDEKFIIQTLTTYEQRTKEIREEMSAQYSLLDKEDLDLLQSISYPNTFSILNHLPEERQTLDEIYEKYKKLSRVRIQDILLLMRERTEELESMNRIMAAYDALDPQEQDVLMKFYSPTQDTIYANVQELEEDYQSSRATIYRWKSSAMKKIKEIYDSDLTQAEIPRSSMTARLEDKYR